MGNTSRNSLPYPSINDAPDVPAWVKNLADGTDAKLPYVSTSTPAHSRNLLWYNPDTRVAQISDGTAWYAIGPTEWTTYTPTWTTSGTQPALGNGQLGGSWQRFGRTIIARGALLAGSTTTFGTGAFRFALPAAAATPTPSFPGFPIWVGSAYAFDNGNTNRMGVCRVEAGGTYVTITSETVAQWDSTIPMTWANGDHITWQITYVPSV